jgi:hypothetical protein
MNHPTFLDIPPQKNVLTLEEGILRTSYWKAFIASETDNSVIPRAIFIPFTDILELAKLQQLVRGYPQPGSLMPIPIFVVGIRAYYSLQSPFPVNQPMNPPVDAVVVLVYQENFREPGSAGEFDYDKDFPTFDLILPVPTAKDGKETRSGGAYSIYDITRPCPNLCDPKSLLY